MELSNILIIIAVVSILYWAGLRLMERYETCRKPLTWVFIGWWFLKAKLRNRIPDITVIAGQYQNQAFFQLENRTEREQVIVQIFGIQRAEPGMRPNTYRMAGWADDDSPTLNVKPGGKYSGYVDAPEPLRFIWIEAQDGKKYGAPVVPVHRPWPHWPETA